VGNSFQDQFLKAGLIDEKQAKQVTKEKRETGKKLRRERGVDESKLQADRARQQQAQHAAQLNKARDEKQRRQAVTAEIRQLIDAHRIEPEESDTPFSYTEGDRIKRLYLSPAQRQRVTKGQLAISRKGGKHLLLPLEIAQKILQRNPDYPMVILTPEESPPPTSDDPYADYVIPDDLIW
ncbi:MAG: DUF2058 domain-containing protein, partial [Gammaproteobacteria bacterium]|nr:DUF2058 domain-containing protein [Gammaproteobacteria bacterium]